MIPHVFKQDCSGCGACRSVCPQNCIIMAEDEEGFLYPQIDKERCAGCHACERVCPSLTFPARHGEPQGYACLNRDEDIRLKSSSGGIFTLLAQKVIGQGGAVFGAAFSEDCAAVRHVCVRTTKELSLLRGSKYVQSRTGDTYKEAERLLKAGVTVLYTGTSCQIAGLKSFLRKEYGNLITQDLICHGAPSPLIWRRYLAEKGRPVQSVSFRDKREGWRNFSVVLKYDVHTEESHILSDDPFMRGFLSDLYLRPSCYRCKAKGMTRCSDITLADFWGAEELVPELFDDKGTSFVLVHSEKGKRLFESVQDRMDVRKTDLAAATAHNTAAVRSVTMPKARKRFYRAARRMTVERAVEKSLHRSFFKRCASKVKRMAMGLGRKG